MSEKASSAQTSCQTARSEDGLLRCFSQKSVTDDSQRNVEAAQKTKTIEKVCYKTINVQEKQQRSYHNGYDTVKTIFAGGRGPPRKGLPTTVDPLT